MRPSIVTTSIFLSLASLALLAPLMLFYWPASSGLDVIGYPLGRDFINVWAGPQIALGGEVLTLFDLRAYHHEIGLLFGHPLPFHNWGYPLFVLPIFWPLSQLPYFWALAVWTVGLFALFAAIVLSQVDQKNHMYALLLLALAPACLINTVGGQNGFLSAALFLGGVLNIDRRPLFAGVLFGLLTFKPHLGIVLPFVLVSLGAWRVITSAAITAFSLFALSVAIFGLDAWRDYLGIVGAYQTGLLRDFEGFYTRMMVSVLAGARTVGLSYSIAFGIQIVTAFVAVAAASWAVRCITDSCQRAFLLTTATLLVTPYAFNYDMTALTAVLAWILFGRLPFDPKWRSIYFLGWLAPTAVMTLNLSGLAVTPLILTILFVLSMQPAMVHRRLAAASPSQKSRDAVIL